MDPKTGLIKTDTLNRPKDMRMFATASCVKATRWCPAQMPPSRATSMIFFPKFLQGSRGRGL